MPTDDEALAAQLRATEDARERAALLEIDYDRLVVAHRHLRRGSNIVSGVFAVIAGVIGGVLLVLGDVPVFTVGSLLGLGVSFVAALAILLVISLLFQTHYLRALTPLRQQIVGGSALAALWAVAFFATLVLCPVDWRVGLMLGFILATTLLSLAGAQSLLPAIRQNHPNLLTAVRQQQALPPYVTLLGYDARWLIACLAWGFVEATGVALLLVFAPASVVVVVLIRAAVTAYETRVAWVDARRGLAVMAVESSIFFVAGVAAVALS